MQRLLMTFLILVSVSIVHPMALFAAPEWRGNVRQARLHSPGRWRGGHWFHGPHHHRVGWWWVVDGWWYWYPRPIYPYPEPYALSVVVQVPTTPAPAPQAQAPVWYYCEEAAGYYPYIATCPGGWRAVPATPPPASALPPPAEEER